MHRLFLGDGFGHWLALGLWTVSVGACGCASPPAPREVVAPPVVSKPVLREPSYANTSVAKIALLDDHVWPPPRIAIDAVGPSNKPDVAAPAGAGGASGGAEGEWVAWEREWLHTIEGAPPTFFVTFVRPDPARSTKVQMVALDVRQLELDMAIGIEGPFPPDEKTLGKWPRTGGLLPRETGVATRVVAAFNGGFRFDGGAWGLTIRRREFMKPAKDVASLLMHDDGRLGFGSFGPDMTTPADVRSLRQNLDPLLDAGVVNPRKRPKWGSFKATAKQVGQRAKRTGICRTVGGNLLYLWGDDLEPADLGNAMKKAGCDFGMHLDMNIWHVGFVFMSFEDAQYKVGHSEALSAAMGVGNKRYVSQPNPKEFFYATLRTPATLSFRADGHTQPAPAWLPAVLSKTEGNVRVTSFDARRVRFALVGGHAELDASKRQLFETTPPAPLSGDDVERVLGSIVLGIAPKNASFGLVLNGATRSPSSAAAATLSIDEHGRLSIVAPGDVAPGDAAPSAHSTAQGPPLIIDGKPLEIESEVAIVIGVTAKGDLLVAERAGTNATTASLVESLLHAGCVRALAPRSPAGGKLERAGRDVIPTGGPETRLFVLADRAPETSYRFDLDEHGTPRWPRVMSPVK